MFYRIAKMMVRILLDVHRPIFFFNSVSHCLMIYRGARCGCLGVRQPTEMYLQIPELAASTAYCISSRLSVIFLNCYNREQFGEITNVLISSHWSQYLQASVDANPKRGGAPGCALTFPLSRKNRRWPAFEYLTVTFVLSQVSRTFPSKKLRHLTTKL